MSTIKRKRWTKAEDKFVKHNLPLEAAIKLGRTLAAVNMRRSNLGLVESDPSKRAKLAWETRRAKGSANGGRPKKSKGKTPISRTDNTKFATFKINGLEVKVADSCKNVLVMPNRIEINM